MILKTAFLSGILLVFLVPASVAQEVKQFTINGNTYYGTKSIPGEIKGLYQYEKTKEPIVEIDYNGGNSFQPHDVPKYPVEYWIETDEKGNIQKETSKVNRNYRVVLILLYGDNGQTGWKGGKKGQYDRIDVTMNIEEGWAIVLGERYRKLP